MRLSKTIVTALGLALIPAFTACGGEEDGSAVEGATKDAEAASESAKEAVESNDLTISYECASGCGDSKEMAATEGAPSHCGVPMTPKP